MSNTYESPELTLIMLGSQGVFATSYDSNGMVLPSIDDGPTF